jgi:hypothetical protein
MGQRLCKVSGDEQETSEVVDLSFPLCSFCRQPASAHFCKADDTDDDDDDTDDDDDDTDDDDDDTDEVDCDPDARDPLCVSY